MRKLNPLAVAALLVTSSACNCGGPPELEGEDAGAWPGADAGSDQTDAGGSSREDGGSGEDGGGAWLDAGTLAFDAGSGDGGRSDGGALDAGAGSFDAGSPDAGKPADAGSPGPSHVHVLIDNFCKTSVSPTELTAALNSHLRLQFHNHSVDYQADVWSSRGYGVLGLERGATWSDPVDHCGGPNPYTESFDVSIEGGGGSACPKARLLIHCQ